MHAAAEAGGRREVGGRRIVALMRVPVPRLPPQNLPSGARHGVCLNFQSVYRNPRVKYSLSLG